MNCLVQGAYDGRLSDFLNSKPLKIYKKFACKSNFLKINFEIRSQTYASILVLRTLATYAKYCPISNNLPQPTDNDSHLESWKDRGKNSF